MLPILGFFGLGILILLVSTDYFIKSAKYLSLALRFSPLIIGMTLVSIGTSLPEMAVSGAALVKNDAGLASGNIIGSNIINVFLVFGIGILTGNIKVGTIKTQKNIYLMLGITIAFLLMYYFRIAPQIAGVLLLGLAVAVTQVEYFWGVNGRNNEDAKFSRKNKSEGLSSLNIHKLVFSLAGIVLGGLLIVSTVEKLSLQLGFSTTILGLTLTAIATSLPELLTTVFSEKDHEDKIT